jgi:succinate dehydrogenase/fumarate reductase flavoprotein subunit
MTATRIDTDVLILGSGIAGLSAALELADFGNVVIR